MIIESRLPNFDYKGHLVSALDIRTVTTQTHYIHIIVLYMFLHLDIRNLWGLK